MFYTSKLLASVQEQLSGTTRLPKEKPTAKDPSKFNRNRIGIRSKHRKETLTSWTGALMCLRTQELHWFSMGSCRWNRRMHSASMALQPTSGGFNSSASRHSPPLPLPLLPTARARTISRSNRDDECFGPSASPRTFVMMLLCPAALCTG